MQKIISGHVEQVSTHDDYDDDGKSWRRLHYVGLRLENAVGEGIAIVRLDVSREEAQDWAKHLLQPVTVTITIETKE